MSSCRWALWGEQVPTAAGTVAHRLAVGDLLSAVEVEGAVFAPHDAGAAAVGARLLLAEGLRLLFQEGGERALGEAGSGSGGELFQSGESSVGAGASLAKGPAGDDFAPLGGQLTDHVEVLGGKLRACHRLSYLGVAENGETAGLSCCKAKGPAGQSVS